MSPVFDELVANGMTQAEIADTLHVSQATVCRYLKKFGLVTRTTVCRRESAARVCCICGTYIASWRTCCSNTCHNIRVHRDYITRWKHGEETGIVSGGRSISKHIRRYLFEKNNDSCQKCGWTARNPRTGSVPLQINHIDGDAANNVEDNLELLCPNCHSLTPTFGSLNRGKGRKNRYLRV